MAYPSAGVTRWCGSFVSPMAITANTMLPGRSSLTPSRRGMTRHRGGITLETFTRLQSPTPARRSACCMATRCSSCTPRPVVKNTRVGTNASAGAARASPLSRLAMVAGVLAAAVAFSGAADRAQRVGELVQLARGVVDPARGARGALEAEPLERRVRVELPAAHGDPAL